ncbi:hypothetical protein [Paraburkholderia sp. J94]|uniref:hypothetical protein n=1 Tax=Paraburkholderia sp. J94 TaxID=2805441 RepID=UPI002AB11A8D|nr:hypothetical protein [Paraburkholderia sp. J94]
MDKMTCHRSVAYRKRRTAVVRRALFMVALLGCAAMASLYAMAETVATVSASDMAARGSFFPIALNQCVYQNPAYWSSGQRPAGLEIQIGGGVPLNCAGPAAQWTALTLDSNPSAYGPCSGMNPRSAFVLNCLITHESGIDLSVGETIFIAPGLKLPSLYNDFPATLPMVVTLPVVSDSAILNSGGDTAIVGFASFQIDYAIGANGRSTPVCDLNPICAMPPCRKCLIGHLTASRTGSTTTGGAAP